MNNNNVAKTELDLHRQDAEKMNAVIKTMTGTATEWDNDHGHYLSLTPVTNMDNVNMTFWSKHVRSWGDGFDAEDMADIVATLKKSRRWKFNLVRKK